MLKLIDLLRMTGLPLDNYKVHFATGKNSPTPLEAFYRGDFKEWQEEQTKQNFKCNYILSLISLGNGVWLFAGIYRVLGVDIGINSPYLYRTELLLDQDDLIGKVIVQYKREFRASYVLGSNFGHLLEVAEIKPKRMSIEEFPGYNSAVISHPKLKIIVSHQEPTWRSALSNVNGVYLIADTSNGKLYVGCAIGENGLWGRWVSYAITGHGDNKELEQLIATNGIGYADNFQYAVLEIADSHATPEFILTRESYWKNALLSRRPFGYNWN
jgi:hypothetical protein